ncbi:hypothetical protein [Aquimarina algiphila]|uniref:Uncharacterized protein n=1 Tax=Aquimarina algiphila TaxID=2047982 RepID=A0A554VRN2_9FLAO|nr:hypothetical protein [Aquimarina algiphila]TSE11305.1 hypothetical protein FOF46_01355 [Aquimarina algiphila]
MKQKKLNTLLGLTDHLRFQYKAMVNDYNKFFSNKQGAFTGEKSTYTPKDGTMDVPSKRNNKRVTTTVKEKLDYFIENTGDFIDALFSQERTNAGGTVKAELIIEGDSWGEFTVLELLRLRSLVEGTELGKLSTMIESIPVRSDSEYWNKSENEEHTGRDIYETALTTGVNKSTVKTPFIPLDPNLQGKELPVNYQAPVVTKDEILELGDYSHQKFSGEISHRERAMMLLRRNTLATAITKALKEANDCPVEESELTGKRIFNYLFYGN